MRRPRLAQKFERDASDRVAKYDPRLLVDVGKDVVPLGLDVALKEIPLDHVVEALIHEIKQLMRTCSDNDTAAPFVLERCARLELTID